MPTTNSQATAHTTPNVGGTSAVTGDSNTGHSSTTSSVSSSATQTKTCRWHTFQSVAGQITAISLKYSWAHSGSFSLASSSGDGTAAISVAIEYSVNGGSN